MILDFSAIETNEGQNKAVPKKDRRKYRKGQRNCQKIDTKWTKRVSFFLNSFLSLLLIVKFF